MLTEDIDITWKLQRNGWDVRFEPKALVWILMPETIKGLWKQRLRWAMGGRSAEREVSLMSGGGVLQGLLPGETLGFTLDPYSILVPFLTVPAPATIESLKERLGSGIIGLGTAADGKVFYSSRKNNATDTQRRVAEMRAAGKI